MPFPNISQLNEQVKKFSSQAVTAIAAKYIIEQLTQLESLSEEAVAAFLERLKKWRSDESLNIVKDDISFKKILYKQA